MVNFSLVLQVQIKEIQADKTPTLHMGALSYSKLLKHCNILNEANIGDTAMLRSLRTRASFLLETKWEVTEDHKVALFLMPDFKRLSALPPNDRQPVRHVSSR